MPAATALHAVKAGGGAGAHRVIATLPAGSAPEDGGDEVPLGLSIVRALVELHGGRIRVSSDGAGRGAKFMVDLPVIESAPAVQGTNRRRAASLRRHRHPSCPP